MLSQYTIGGPDHETRELSDYAELCTRLQHCIVRLAGSFTAAVHLLEEHGIKSRLSLDEIDIAGGSLDLLADLQLMQHYLQSELDFKQGPEERHGDGGEVLREIWKAQEEIKARKDNSE